jgi:signal transduction histidine kinase
MRLAIWSHLRPTVRLRLTGLFLALFLFGGAALVGLTYVLVQHATAARVVGLPSGLRPTGGLPSDVPLFPRDGRLLDLVRSYAQSVRAETLHELLVASSIGLGVIAVVGVIMAWILAGRTLRPLQRITATARRLSQETLHQRIALAGPDDELKELADTFDDMLSRLEGAFASQQRFIANISHELRTPLAVQRTLIEVALADRGATRAELRTVLGQLHEAAEEQQRLIESLLVLAVSERGLDATRPLSMREVIGEAVGSAAGEAAAKGVRVSQTISDAVVLGSEPLLVRMLANLVENGIRHNRTGGWVDVRLDVLERSVRVVVTNSGPVVAADQISGVFEPFQRLGRDRVASAGVGLGLSIVRAVARAHGGSVAAEPLPEGGLEVVISLPAGPDQSSQGRPPAPSSPQEADLSASA